MIPSFASENFAGVQEDILKALLDANTGFAPSYGKDELTLETIDLFKQHFGDVLSAYFTFNGTGANNFGLASMTERYQSIFCSDVAHIYVDESTAPEALTGCRLYPVASLNGKIIVDDLKDKLKRVGDVHHPQPRVVSVTQPTEYGTVYTVDELAAIKSVCIDHGLLLHMDGARLFNAAAYLKLPLKAITSDIGVDVLTLGGTKAGMMFGEAVLFFGREPASLSFHHKRSMQLASKNRFIAAQFKRLLQDDLWQQLANHTNSLASLFESEILNTPSLKIAYPIQTNAVFLKMPKDVFNVMRSYASFYYWNEQKEEARLIFSFSNTVEEISAFSKALSSYEPF